MLFKVNILKKQIPLFKKRQMTLSGAIPQVWLDV